MARTRLGARLGVLAMCGLTPAPPCAHQVVMTAFNNHGSVPYPISGKQQPLTGAAAMRAVAFVTLEGSAGSEPALTSSPAFQPTGGIPGDAFADVALDLHMVRPAAVAGGGRRDGAPSP